jgi:hypothetical protein
MDLSARVIASGGRIGVITADRWLPTTPQPSFAGG